MWPLPMPKKPRTKIFNSCSSKLIEEEKNIHIKSKSSSMISHHSCSSNLERQQEVTCRKNFRKLKKYQRFAKTCSQQKEKVQKNTEDLRRTELRVTVKYLGSQWNPTVLDNKEGRNECLVKETSNQKQWRMSIRMSNQTGIWIYSTTGSKYNYRQIIVCKVHCISEYTFEIKGMNVFSGDRSMWKTIFL